MNEEIGEEAVASNVGPGNKRKNKIDDKVIAVEISFCVSDVERNRKRYGTTGVPYSDIRIVMKEDTKEETITWYKDFTLDDFIDLLGLNEE